MNIRKLITELEETANRLGDNFEVEAVVLGKINSSWILVSSGSREMPNTAMIYVDGGMNEH